MTKLLFISPFFHPENISTGRYNTHLVNQFVRDGHDVEVVTSVPFYPSWVPNKTKESLDGVRIRRAGLAVRYPKPLILRRMVLEVWFAMHVLKSCIGRMKDFDYVVAVIPPSLFCFLLTLMIPKRVELIGIVHDLQAVFTKEAQEPSWLNKNLAKAIGWVESRSLRRCSRLVFVSRGMGSLATRVYSLDPKKVRIAYPFITLQPHQPVWPSPSSPLALMLPRRTGDTRHLVYCGALGMKQNPQELKRFFLDATRAIENLHVHIFSQGPVYENLKLDPELSANARIHFDALLNEALLPYVYAAADLNLVPQILGTSDGSLPSKLPNILACRGKVMAICDASSEIHQLIKKYGSGLSTTSWQSPFLVSRLKEYLATASGNRHDFRQGMNLESNVIQAFNVAHVTAQILNQDHHNG